MSRRWLSLALLLLSACYRNNPANCVVTRDLCSTGQVCDPVIERCVNPNAMRCDSTTTCPTGFSCNGQTLRCDPDTSSNGLSITGISNPYIKAEGADVVIVTGTGFQPGAAVLLNGAAAVETSFVSSTELRVSTPFRTKGTNKCGKLPLTVVNPDQTRQTVPDFFAYYFDATSLFSHPALGISITSDVGNLVMADLNRDGVDELTVSRPNLEPQIFSSSAGMLVPPGLSPSARIGSWVAADLETHFGNLLVADSVNGLNHVYRFAKGTGALSAAEVLLFLGGTPLTSVVPVDLDEDGFRDVLGLQSNGQLLGLTRSSNWMTTSSIQNATVAIAATSFVADRYFANTVRAAAVSANDSKLVIFRYNSAMRKLVSDTTYSLPEKTVQILDGDVDGDGSKDLIVLLQSGAVKIFMNQGSFSDLNTKDFNFASAMTAIVVGDINCDGAADVIGLAAPNTLQVWSLRTGPMPKVSFTNSGKPGSTVADLDGDAIGDLLLFNAANQPLLRYGTVKQ